MLLKRAYHGTPVLERVLREGLRADQAIGECSHIWLAKNPGDAAAFGDVVEVDMTGIPGDFEEGSWQGCYHGGDLSSERLRVYKDRRNN